MYKVFWKGKEHQFVTMADAVAFAHKIFVSTGIVVAIENN